jgi:hypothetical protein
LGRYEALFSDKQDRQQKVFPGSRSRTWLRKTAAATVLSILVFVFVLVSPLDASVIMQDNFDDGLLTGWAVDESPSGAQVTETGGALTILAHANTYAHVERTISHDDIVVKARVKVSDENCGDTWAPGVILYWGPGDWTRTALDAVNKTVFSTYVLGGEESNASSRPIPARDFCRDYIWLAIGMTDSQIGHYFSMDGLVWNRVHYRLRRGKTGDPPVKVILGKGYGTGRRPYSQPDLDNDYILPGGYSGTWIDDFCVTIDEPLVEGPFLRKFPYPYSSALTIVSDVDGMNSTEFLTMHQFLNTKQDMSLNPTDDAAKAMGVGVGLDISDSFWMFNDDPGPKGADGMSYFHFDGDECAKTTDSDLIRTYAHAGYLDCIHSFGHFGRTGGFTRELAITALEEMNRARVLPEVWSNHGDGYHHDNLGHPWNKENLGDVPGSKAYHSDISVYPDGPIRFLWNFNFDGIVDDPVISPLRVADLYDGKAITAFTRFYGPGWQVDDLHRQISVEALDDLIFDEGYMFVANHLQSTESPTPVYFDAQTQRALRDLEARHRDGKIYVTTTAKLLRYKYAIDNLKWSWSGSCDSVLTITIDEIDDQATGGFTPTLEDLRGVTICTPCASKTDVIVAGASVTHELDFNPIDGLGFESVSFPIVPLPPFPEWISDGYTRKSEDYTVPGYDYLIDVTNMDTLPHAPTLAYVGIHSFEIQEVRQAGLCLIWIPDRATVHLPLLDPGEIIEGVHILNGARRRDIPRLVEVSGDSVEIERAAFLEDSSLTSITVAGMGWAELRIEDSECPFPGAENRFNNDGSQVVGMIIEGRERLRSLNMRVRPSGGAVGVIVEEWTDGEGGYKRWLQEVDGAEAVGYEMGDLAPLKRHAVKADGSLLGTYMSNGGGWLEFEYNGVEPSVVIEVTDLSDPNRGEFWLTSVFPSPFISSEGKSATCLFAAPGSQRTKLAVFDAKGRLVAKLVDKDMGPGIHRVEWDGLDDEGTAVPSGVYFYRLETGGHAAHRRVMVLR